MNDEKLVRETINAWLDLVGEPRIDDIKELPHIVALLNEKGIIVSKVNKS